MRFEVGSASIIALIDHPDRTRLTRLDVSELSILPEEDLSKLLDACVRYGVGKKPSSQQSFVTFVLRRFGRYLNSAVSKYSGNLPTEIDEWIFLTHQFGLWYISHPGSEAKYETRCDTWQAAVCPWLDFLQEDGLLPIGVTWPNLRLPAEEVSLGLEEKARVIGELPNSIMDDENVDQFIDKTIAGPIFWRTDVAYLDEIEARLRVRDKALGQALLDHWVRLVKDYRTGKRLLTFVSKEKWASYVKLERRHTSSLYYTSPNFIDGHLWALRCLRQQLDDTDDIQCLSRSVLRAHPALSYDFLKSELTTPVKPLKDLSALTEEQCNLLRPRNIFNRFLGVLNTTDFSVALALLIREHPNLNPSSLASAKVLNGQNKSHLVVSGESGSQIFSVDKPRAKSRKYAVLSHTAAQVFNHIIRVTEPIRALLRRANHPHWRYLFLGDVHQGSVGHPACIRSDLLVGGSQAGVTLLNLYPILAEVGLVKGTVDFAKIRHTQGVIEWFETGSPQAVARRLGNSPRTVIQHYIPSSLIVAWLERIIRKFQNTILVIAAREEEWLLEVVDMPTTQELNIFLAQLVCDLPFGSSPIADKVHEYFNPAYQREPSSFIGNQGNGTLQVRLSVNSLALLLAYRQWSHSHLTLDAQIQPDALTGLTPKYFIDLAGMLQAAASSLDVGEKLREFLDLARLQKCYQQAIVLVPNLVERITGLSACSVLRE